MRNGHDLTATRALVCIGGGKKERVTKSLPGLARTINGHDLINAGAHIQSAPSGSPDLETIRRPPVRNGHDLKQKEPGSVATRTRRGDAPADFRRDE